jgi:tRNA A-37 threonylcarbamoyl transferase component Bud32
MGNGQWAMGNGQWAMGGGVVGDGQGGIVWGVGARVRVLWAGREELASAWREALADRPWVRGERIKMDGDRGVWRTSALGSVVCVKVRPARGLRRARAGLGLTDLGRSVRGAHLLARAGVGCARVFAHALVGADEVLVTEWLEGPTLLERLASGDEVGRASMLDRAGDLIGHQLRAGLFNRDHKPSNVIVTSADGSLGLVDVGGVRRTMRSGSGMVVCGARMCASVAIEPMGVGYGLSEAELDLVVASAAAAACSGVVSVSPGYLRPRMARLVRRLIETHGDATPRVDPLRSASGHAGGL